MILRVGAFLYRVHFVQGYIEHEGERCLGLCDNDAHEIWVSDVPGLPQQIQVICHEYMEAWIFHFGQNLRDKEDYCDLFGMAMAQFVMDLTHQLHRFAEEAGEMGAGTVPDTEAVKAIDASTTAADMVREAVATKLAAKVRQMGLRVGRVYEGEQRVAKRG